MVGVGTGRRVGVCDDEAGIRGLLQDALEGEGYTPVLAHDGREAVRLFAPDRALAAMVLDIGLPDSDGRDVLGALRSAGQQAPAVFLTARGQLHDRISGFAAGGDDYLVKPFAIEELLARLRVVIERTAPPTEAIAPVTLDPARMLLSSGTATRRLSPTEYRIAAALLARPGQVVRRADLRAAGWPLGAIVDDNTLDSYIRRVRHHLDQVHAAAVITTVRGVGYALE